MPERIQLKRKEYSRQWRASADRPRAECHPDRPAQGKKLCNSCYQRWRYKEDPDFRALKLAQAAEWKAKNPEKAKQRDRASKLKAKYGITIEQYDQMLAEQNGGCAICAKPGDPLHVDHDHETGKVRALLCLPCNGSVAWIERIRRADDEWVAAAHAYLEKFS